MSETLHWWLAATLIGLIAVPYAFRLFRFLPDRGYAVARVLGIVLVVHPLWLLAVLGLMPYTAGSAMLLLAALAVGAVMLVGRDRHELREHLRARLTLVIASEIVFAAALFLLAGFRAYAPDIDATEKLFEASLLNGVLGSTLMPPADPWFGGEEMSYYYGGYLVTALFIKLTTVPPEYGFNLGVVLTGALTSVSLFGLGANAVLMTRATRSAERGVRNGEVASPSAEGRADVGDERGAGGEPRPSKRSLYRAPHSALVGGLLCVLMFMVIGNLEGAIELAAAHGWGSPEMYQRLGIEGLTGQVRTSHWYPDEHWFWWRATRMGSELNIMEIPFFSFMLGDLHAHVLVLPFSLLSLTAALDLLRSGERPGLGLLRRRPLHTVLLGVFAGMLGLSNSWDLPVFVLLLLAVAFALNLPREGPTARAAGRALAYVVPVALLAIVLFIPFYAHLRTATGTPNIVELNNLTEGVDAEAMVAPPHHFLIVWGPLLVATGSGIVAQAVRRRAWRATADDWTFAGSLVMLPLLCWALAIVGKHGSFGALVDELRVRATSWAFGSYWIVQLAVVSLILLALLTVLKDGRRPHPERRAGRTFTLLVAATALMVLHGIELFYILEPAIPSRINTLFKFSFVAWMFLAAAGGAMVVDLLEPWWRRARLGPALWTAAATIVLALAVVYPVTAAMNRTNGFTGTPTLDGLAFLHRQNPDEYAAIMWLRANLLGRPLMLEATGPNYSQGGRISAHTGFPTVLGWQGHQEKLRGGGDFAGHQLRVQQRAYEIDTIFRTTDAEQARALLDQFGVSYVYFGRLEAVQYGTEGLEKFDKLGHVVYRNGGVIIYQVSGQAPPLGQTR